jgi:uncharacterized membrane protein
MKFKSSSYFLLMVLIFAFCIGVSALGYSNIKDKAIPLCISALVIVLGLIQLSRELMEAKKELKEKAENSAEGESAFSEMKSYLLVFAWIAALVLSIYIFGFLISIFLFIAAYLKTTGSSWSMSIVPAMITTAIVYVAFIRFFGGELFQGVLFGGYIEWL